MKLTQLEVTHSSRGVDGERLEPEEQVVRQIGSSAVAVQLASTPSFVGGSQGRALTQDEAAAVAAINARGGLLQTARLERSVSADTAAKEATRTCFTCKNWDPNIKGHPFFRKGGEESGYRALAKGYLESPLVAGLQPTAAIHEAEAMALASGVCHAMQDENGADIFARIDFTCHKWQARNWLMQKLMNKKKDEIMRAAQGGFAAKVFIDGGARK